MNCQENLDVTSNDQDILSKGASHSDEKKSRSSVLKSAKKYEQKERVVSNLANDETSLEVEHHISNLTEVANIEENLIKMESKPGTSNGYKTGSSTKKILTNKRMSVPLEKKPKKTFEEALFGATPSVINAKRTSTGEEKCVTKTSKKYSEKVYIISHLYNIGLGEGDP